MSSLGKYSRPFCFLREVGAESAKLEEQDFFWASLRNFNGRHSPLSSQSIFFLIFALKVMIQLNYVQKWVGQIFDIMVKNALQFLV